MKELYSIGEVAAETGISVDTVRVWERRYGRPAPVRLPSGHRRYTHEQLCWLRRVAEALALGHRPGLVVRADEEELSGLLCQAAELPADQPEVAALLAIVRGMRGRELRAALRAAWDELGPRRFLAERLTPFLTSVGQQWAAGELEVRHEHLVSEVLQDLLRELRDAAGEPPGRPQVLIATLSGEQHALGLRMVDLACAVRGVPSQVLGTELPVDQIARAAAELRARAVLVSVSLATSGIETDRRLAELRAALSERVELVVGGRGARDGLRRPPRGLRYLPDFDELDTWLAELAARSGAAASS